MQICTVLKLQANEREHDILLKTLQACNAACDSISRVAFEHQEFRQYDLHELVYHNIRAETELPANHVIRCIAKVAHSYKLDHDTLREFNPLGAIELDSALLSFRVKERKVSIKTTSGRLKFVYSCSPEQRKLLKGTKHQSDLLLREGEFYLSVVVSVSEPEPYVPEGTLGIDLGIVNIATDSEGHRYSGEPVKKIREKYRKFRQDIQKVKTRSARKKMAKRRKKESRYVRDINHCISKKIVRTAFVRKKTLAIESLTGIRQRGNRLNRAVRTEIHNWSFAQLKGFLVYKARRAGVPLIELDARYSSQQCSRCGHTEIANRPDQETFCCRYCCFQANADENSALVLEARVEQSAYPRFHMAVLTNMGGQAVSFTGR